MADPDDLAWRKQIQPSGPCPPGRRPYHTILTAQNSLYQQWQTKIFYYHFRRVQREGPYGGRCTAACSKCFFGRAPARLLCLLRARLAALGAQPLPRVLELPPRKSPIPLPLAIQVPNSLGPGELLVRYGTSAQQAY